ncbi:DUF6894 family protein [Sphingomonas hylomeconis]|uniref:DUF6894 family protein n=1 Tax=Sphingomonas hylomeconis TaxID=1395958 RepID=A0ABV7SRQ6_9SPHN|nr:hypothetical protein [Sphingomonas hylomeconis]
MPLYRFQVVGENGDNTVELESLEDARCEAIKLAGTIFCMDGETFWEDRDWTLNVSDEAGLILFSLMLTAVDSPAVIGGNDR